MEIGFVGLGKMGGNLAKRLKSKGWKVKGYDQKQEVMEGQAKSLQELAEGFNGRKLFWVMVPAGKPVDEVIFGKDGLMNYLKKGDIVIDGGNSFYKDSVARHKKLKAKGIHFIDVGVSGGPGGALNGASLMIGGDKNIFEELEPLFLDLSERKSYQFFEGAGAGHFVKMIHNGIEYGIMQSIAEGFAVMKKAKYQLDLKKVAEVYNKGSVIESKLIGWLESAFRVHGEELKSVSGTVSHSGEGEWTIKTAKEMKMKTKIIEESLKFRVQSKRNPSYAGKILSALREQFGGHSIK